MEQFVSPLSLVKFLRWIVHVSCWIHSNEYEHINQFPRIYRLFVTWVSSLFSEFFFFELNKNVKDLFILWHDVLLPRTHNFLIMKTFFFAVNDSFDEIKKTKRSKAFLGRHLTICHLIMGQNEIKSFTIGYEMRQFCTWNHHLFCWMNMVPMTISWSAKSVDFHEFRQKWFGDFVRMWKHLICETKTQQVQLQQQQQHTHSSNFAHFFVWNCFLFLSFESNTVHIN